MTQQHFSELELKAREILATVRDGEPATIAVINVFRAMWSSSLPADRIRAVSDAINHAPMNIDKALPGLVRTKVLRSRVQGGVRLYEINL